MISNQSICIRRCRLKPEWNRRYYTITCYASAVTCIIVLLFFYLTHTHYVTGALNTIRQVFDPIIIGCIIAYLVYPLVKKLESSVFAKCKEGKKPRHRLARNLSISLAYLIILLCLVLFLLGVGPQIISAYREFTDKYESYLNNLNSWIRSLIGTSGFLSEQYDKLLLTIQESLSNLFHVVIDMLMGSYTAVFRFFADFVEQAMNLLLGVVISIYLLAAKETLFVQIRKVASCILSPSLYERIGGILSLTHRVYGGFVIGKIIDSLIIGLLTLVSSWILQIPFAPLIAIIVGVTNVIPIFGPFIGAIPSALIVLVTDPPKVIVFIILIFLIQQLDGNVIGPKILGNQVGISALGVIVSITVMGSLLGVTGMFIGVPTFAVLYTLLMGAVDSILKKKQLPTELDAYRTEMPRTKEFYENAAAASSEDEPPSSPEDAREEEHSSEKGGNCA